MADDLYFFPEAFASFAVDLDRVVMGVALTASIASTGCELAIAMEWREKHVELQLKISEWQGPFEPTTVLSSGLAVWNTDTVHRWVRELTEFSGRLRDWMLEIA